MKLKEPLIKSSMNRIAGKIAMIARRATKVVARTTMPRSATSRARDFSATLTGTGFAGGLSRCARCEGDRPFASSHALHPIPQNRVCGQRVLFGLQPITTTAYPLRVHAGLNQRFLKCWLVLIRRGLNNDYLLRPHDAQAKSASACCPRAVR